MKITMIFNNRIPTERAHGVQIIKMCEALAIQEAEVELIIPGTPNKIKEGIFRYYQVKNNFIVKKMWCLNIKENYRIRYFTFILSLLLAKFKKENIIYTRHPEIAWLYSLLGYRVIFELHNWHKEKKKKYLKQLRKANKIIVTTGIIREELIGAGFAKEKIIKAPNGVDLEKFNLTENIKEIRAKLSIPQNKIILIYTGNMSEKKGVYTILKSIDFLPSEFIAIFVGGMSGDIERFKKSVKDNNRVIVMGHQPPNRIPLYLKAADILILANSQENIVEKHYTSPLKLFEYLASGRAVIASEVPAIKEFVNEELVEFFKPDDPEDLARAIKNIKDNNALREKLIKNSLALVKNYTWEKRADKIISFIKSYESR
ncbi:MAG: glycosyltransferase family 4 protein [Patescibacteria group bacterium]